MQQELHNFNVNQSTVVCWYFDLDSSSLYQIPINRPKSRCTYHHINLYSFEAIVQEFITKILKKKNW